MERDLDDAPVRDHHHVPVLVTREDRVELQIDASLEWHRAARDDIPARFLGPQRPFLRVTLGQLFGRESLPQAQVDLPQRLRRARCRCHRLADQAGRLESPLQIAGVEPGKAPAGEPASYLHGLAATFCGKRRVELALDAVLPVPGRLAMPDKKETRGRWLGWEREFGRLRARECDLAIYTSFS